MTFRTKNLFVWTIFDGGRAACRDDVTAHFAAARILVDTGLNSIQLFFLSVTLRNSR